MSFLRGNEGLRRLAAGVKGIARLGLTSELMTADGHGRYTDPSMKGNVFWGVSTSAITLANGASTSSTFTLYNPLNSGKLLSLLFTGYMNLSGGPAGGYITLTQNYQITTITGTSTANVKQGSCGIGGPSPMGAGQVYSASTWATNMTFLFPLASLWSIGTSPATNGINTPCTVETGGLITIYPGGGLGMAASTGSVGGNFFWHWEEIAL